MQRDWAFIMRQFIRGATENIDAIIDIIQKLVDSGYAYNVDGDVYYSTKKFKSYGKLSHQPLEDLESGQE